MKFSILKFFNIENGGGVEENPLKSCLSVSRVQEMSGRTPPSNQDLSSNFQRSFINLLPERVQSYINMPVSTLAPPMQHAAATDVVAKQALLGGVDVS